jgi:K+-sensing histidine kinase KdpD
MVLAVGAPLVAALVLVPFRDHLARTNSALLLVVVVVGVAALGNRLAGCLAAVSAGLWFDLFLTRPYQSLKIDDRDDLETTLLLVVVGVLVSELAVWGHRQQLGFSRSQGYLDGIAQALEAVAPDASPAVVVERVRCQLLQILDLVGCRYDPGPSPETVHPRLRPDGEVEVDEASCDIAHFGLPTNTDIELPVGLLGDGVGRFWLKAGPRSRPGLPERLVAVALAERAASALRAGSVESG